MRQGIEGGELRRGDEVGGADEEFPWSRDGFCDCCGWPQGMWSEWLSENWPGVARSGCSSMLG